MFSPPFPPKFTEHLGLEAYSRTRDLSITNELPIP